MDRLISKSDSQTAMHLSGNSSGKLKSEPTANLDELLAAKLKERAHSAYNTEQNGGSEPKPYSQVELDVLVSVKEEYVLGRKHEKKKLGSQLLAPNEGRVQFSVIPIVGKSGIGKTTLMGLVYEDQTVQKHFELRAWVKVGGLQHQQLCYIARKILKSATGMVCPLNSLVELDEMVVDALLCQRSLIVLDDVNAMDTKDWKHMKERWFRSVGLGSKVIITTSKQEVANVVANKQAIILGELSKTDCWSLFSSRVFSRYEEEEDQGVIKKAKHLAARCKGVPLSLKLLAGSWTNISEVFDQISNSSSLDVSSALSISVLCLPHELFICFAYCGIFPYGHLPEKEKLIKMWIADGVVKQGSKAMEDIGRDYFHQLLCRSFFTDITRNEYSEIVQAEMPSVIHELAQEMAKIAFKGNIVAGMSQKSCQSIQEVYSPKQFPKLVLSLFDKHIINPNSSFVDYKRLRSLDLSGTRDIRMLPEYVSTMRKLRYLNLSHTRLTKLPKSITSLTSLQTLDLSGCYYLRVLPKKMSNLSQLRHLDLSWCNSLFYTPVGIGRLNSLMTMPLFVLSEKHPESAGLGELHNLNELRGVLHIRNLENVREINEAQAADLKHKERLRQLGLFWSQRVDESHAVLECLQPNPKLQILEITGYGAYGFPSWMGLIRSLVKLFINDCRQCTKLPTLGNLPHLKELQLKGLMNIRSIGQEFYGDGNGEAQVFPSLEMLRLHDMPNLNRWLNAAIAEGFDHLASCAFPSLKTLSIQGCPQLQSFPTLRSVTELVVWKSNSKILSFLTGIETLSSIVINQMDVKKSFGGSSSFNSVKKLIVVNCTELDASSLNKFTDLEHLRIRHCLKLENIVLPHLRSLQELNVMDCPELKEICLPESESTLTELSTEDCPRLQRIGVASSLKKLIVRNCLLLSISPCEIEELQGLEFLFVSKSPEMQTLLSPETQKLRNKEESRISHVPCVLVDWENS